MTARQPDPQGAKSSPQGEHEVNPPLETNLPLTGGFFIDRPQVAKTGSIC
jgi:hypothetical protein